MARAYEYRLDNKRRKNGLLRLAPEQKRKIYRLATVEHLERSIIAERFQIATTEVTRIIEEVKINIIAGQ